MKPSEKSIGIAARCWCDDETKDIEMDTRLATAFAIRLDRIDKLIHSWAEAGNILCAVDFMNRYGEVADKQE